MKFLTFLVEEIDGLTITHLTALKCVFEEGNLNRSLHSINFSQKSLLTIEGGDATVNDLAADVSLYM